MPAIRMAGGAKASKPGRVAGYLDRSTRPSRPPETPPDPENGVHRAPTERRAGR